MWWGDDGTDGEIFLYNGSTTQLTDNDTRDEGPQINANGDVMWYGYGGTDSEIFLYINLSGPINQLITDVVNLNLHTGISNNLDGKLGAALNAIDDVTQNNDVAAINSLYVFINAVEAQRGNNIFDDEDADALISDAQAIIALLGG